MEKKIFFRFSEDIKLFDEFANLKVSFHGQLILMLPVLCYYGDYFDKELLFETTFRTVITNIDDISNYHKAHNLDTFFRKFFPQSDFLQILTKKAEQWINEGKPEAVEIKDTDYICGTEFIEVDEDTSFCGNFEQDGKEGCHMKFGVNIHAKPLASFEYLPYVSEYDIPYSLKKEGLSLYKMTKEEKFQVFKDLGLKVALDVFKRRLNENHTHRIEEHHCPFYLRLQGNDDDSWTRYFCTQEEMMDEVYRLRRCQPISKELDVYGNSYHFTN